MFTAALQLNMTDDGSWDFLPQDLWVKLLDLFVLPQCSTIGFGGIEESDDLLQIACFEDWQPVYVGRGKVLITWRNSYSQQVRKENEFGCFEYSEELHNRIRVVPNIRWHSYDEYYRADDLYFFQNEQVLMIGPQEGSIMFCDLSESQRSQLLQIDERISPNLHPLSDRKVFSGIVKS